MTAGAAERDTTDAVFRARGVSKVYRVGEVEVHALRGVDVDLYRGEIAVLLGASGSGKSTLLNILGGLDVPTSGRGDLSRDHGAADVQPGHDFGAQEPRVTCTHRERY